MSTAHPNSAQGETIARAADATREQQAVSRGSQTPIKILYTNWRGVTAVREIVPGAPARAFWFGSTEWHPEPQWLLCARDVTGDEGRDFALSGIKAWGAEAVDAALSASPAQPQDAAPALGEEVRRLNATATQGEATAPEWGTDFRIGGKLAGMMSPNYDGNGKNDRAFIVALINAYRSATLPLSPAQVAPVDGGGLSDKLKALGARAIHAAMLPDPDKAIVGWIVPLEDGFKGLDFIQRVERALSTTPASAGDGDLRSALSPDTLAHVKRYGVKEGDPRRTYTQCQLEMAVRLSVKSALAPTAKPDPAGREEIARAERKRVIDVLMSEFDAPDKIIARAADAILAARPVAEGVAGWRPIETAPKDATVQIVVVHRNPANASVPTQPTVYPAYIDEEGRVCCPGTWKPESGFDGPHWRATLWQPLAASPATASATPSEGEK